MRGITKLLDSLTPEKRLLIIGSAFVDVIVHVPRLPLSGEDVEGTSRQQLVGGGARQPRPAPQASRPEARTGGSTFQSPTWK